MAHYPVLFFFLCLVIAGVIGVIGWIILAVALVVAALWILSWVVGRVGGR